MTQQLESIDRRAPKRAPKFSNRGHRTLKIDTTKDQTLAWISLALFAGVVALLGGSSRPDAAQISILRPTAALFLIPALYYLNGAQLKYARAPLVFLGLLAIWMLLQLVPLPPSWWQALPQREVLVELDRTLGLDEVWRPISWVPSRGWNTLASLIVPIAALLLAAAMRANARMLLLIIAGIGLFDALWGLLQVASGRSDALYLYAITNRGSAVGIFANENHSAVFSAISLLVITRLGSTARQFGEAAWLRLSYPPAFALILLAVLVSGSRAGLAMSFLALLASSAIMALAITQARSKKRAVGPEQWLLGHPRLIVLIFAGAMVALISAFFWLERAPGLADALNQNAFEDLRWQILPVLEEMVGRFWLLGIGFGSFDKVYHVYEPTGLLLPQYVNLAHNDWAQFVLEGGAPATALLVIALGWIGISLRALLSPGKGSLASIIFWGSVLAIVSTASLVDYPLRTPIFMMVMAWLALALKYDRQI